MAERRSSSDWAQNCSKLEGIQAELRKALCKLHRCQAFNLETITSQVSLQSFVERFSFTSSTEVSESVQKENHNLLKKWMPPNHVLNAVQEYFSPKMSANLKPASAKGGSNNKDQEEPDELEDDDEERNESERVLQDIIGGNPKNKNKTDWLSHNYLNLADLSLPTALYRNNCFGNFDLNEYGWLLEADPWKLSPELRGILILVIMRHKLQACLKEFLGLKEEYEKVCADNTEINKQKRIALLKEAKIIGMTTTGAAINQDILNAVAPSIILVEEAGEILEPHLMALLSSSVDHLILIGDHKQLRPPVNNYQLHVGHNLGLSMLERLAENNKLPYVTLDLQSRMREEFLPMIKPIYPALRSNSSEVNGARNQPASCMATTRYFWNHSVEETIGRSPTNIREIQMVIALLKWLLAEGLKHEEITVICAYNGQVSQIRKEIEQIKQADQSIDVQTIDRYQGSENRIVIASLVRSNKEGNIGYLMAQNRLCVTVSRARSGLYMCGNAETLSQQSPHWKTLLDGLKHDNCLGDKIHLICPRHPNGPSIPLHHNDAQKFSPKVCAAPCSTFLSCGHQCTSTCHSGEHALCKVDVQYRFSACCHSTMKPCSVPDTSMRCVEMVQVRLENCNHIKNCLCWKRTENVRSTWMCEVPCGKTLPCTHPCTLFCGQDCGSKPCPTCAEIAKVKARKEKELRINQMKEKLSGIHREIEKLKKEPLVGPIFKELSPEGETAPEYRMVQDRTEKFIQKAHKELPLVTRIQKITNTKLEVKFLEAKSELVDILAPTQLLFHGTDDKGVEGITTNGFRLPSANKDNMFGVGCYFATDSSKSAQRIYTKGSNKLLLCEVLIGRPWSVNTAKADLDYKQIRAKSYDSVFSMRNSRASGGTEFDEYIIYNPSQAIPRYVVHYENMDCNTNETSLLRDKSGPSIGRRVLQASANSFAGVTLDEMHFRFAEAQFYRTMSKHKNLKVEKVEYTWNHELDERYSKTRKQFEAEKKPVDEKLVFHGTTKESIDKIVREGFKVGGKEGVPIRCGAVYGTGVYTAAKPEISVPYSGGSGMILLSAALCGNLNDDYKLGGSSDVFVVTRGDQLLPMYIVHFSNS